MRKKIKNLNYKKLERLAPGVIITIKNYIDKGRLDKVRSRNAIVKQIFDKYILFEIVGLSSKTWRETFQKTDLVKMEWE